MPRLRINARWILSYAGRGHRLAPGYRHAATDGTPNDSAVLRCYAIALHQTSKRRSIVSTPFVPVRAYWCNLARTRSALSPACVLICRVVCASVLVAASREHYHHQERAAQQLSTSRSMPPMSAVGWGRELTDALPHREAIEIMLRRRIDHANKGEAWARGLSFLAPSELVSGRSSGVVGIGCTVVACRSSTAIGLASLLHGGRKRQ